MATTTKIAHEVDFQVNAEALNHHLKSLLEDHAALLNTLLRRHFLIYISLALFFLSGLVAFLAALVALLPIYVAAISLAALSLGGCLAFLWQRYHFLNRPERYRLLVAYFGDISKQIIPFHEEVENHHLFCASAYTMFAEHLKGHAPTLLMWKYLPTPCQPLFARVGEFFFQKEIHTVRELLLQAALRHHLDLIKGNPLNLTFHSQLASTYVLLSHLFKEKWLPEGADQRFSLYTRCAVTEFEIIAAYAPNDPWVYAQLALSYRDLQLHEEEIQICETILKLCPTDKETRLRLGILYFNLGDNAAGLRVYQELRQQSWQLAEQLISHYGKELSQLPLLS